MVQAAQNRRERRSCLRAVTRKKENQPVNVRLEGPNFGKTKFPRNVIVRGTASYCLKLTKKCSSNVKD